MSLSKWRRQRAVRTRKRLWNLSQGPNPETQLARQDLIDAKLGSAHLDLTVPEFIPSPVIDTAPSSQIAANRFRFLDEMLDTYWLQQALQQDSSVDPNMIGSWESLDLDSGGGKLLVTDSSFLDKQYTSGGKSESQTGSSEDIPELTSAQMRSFVDTVVEKISDTAPQWQNVPIDVAAEFVESLKSVFLDKDEVLYSKAQAVKLMEETGKCCGELVLKYQ